METMRIGKSPLRVPPLGFPPLGLPPLGVGVMT